MGWGTRLKKYVNANWYLVFVVWWVTHPHFFYPVGTEGVRRRHFYPLADSVRATGKNPGTGRKNPRFFVETPGHIMENLYYP